MIEQFTLLRPFWLLALLPLAALIWQLMKGIPNSRSWQSVVDPLLLPHLLAGKFQARQSGSTTLVAVIGFLVIIALSGPVWEKLPQPVYRQQAALVIALDLSRSMDATDVKPSRLTRARHKIADILTRRSEGQTALVVYAADAFVVTPLTEDVGTIEALLPSLTTDLMPTQGSRVDRALRQALRLFDNSGVKRGDILIVSDGLSTTETTELGKILSAQSAYRISILGVGSESGGPIPPVGGGFLKDATGSIVIARMPVKDMARLADTSSGEFQSITSDDRDILNILNHMQRNRFQTEATASDQSADIWREQGPWLLVLILPFVALVFRRGILFLLPLLLIPVSPGADAFGWNELWQNQNQRAGQQFEQGDHQTAAELFKHPGWKASSYYRAGDYDEALKYWTEQEGENAFYNQGNALAKLERFEEAIKAYERTLDINPHHQDASYNKKLLEKLMQQQQQEQQKNQQDQQQDQQGSEQQQSEDSAQNQQSGEGQDQQQRQDENNPQNSQSQQDIDPQDQETTAQDTTQPQASEVDQQAKQEATENQQLAEMEQQMSDQAADQWLRKIPDDPGGLLRRKFIYQYQNRTDGPVEENPW